VHRLGTWFNGKAGLHGNNMALPMGFKTSGQTNLLLRSGSRRGAYYVDGKTSSTRDLVSINSENSAGRHRRRRKTNSVVSGGYRVDASSSSPFGSSGSEEDEETCSRLRRAPGADRSSKNQNKKLASASEASASSRTAGPDDSGQQVEIVNFRKLPSPQFPLGTSVTVIGSPSASTSSSSGGASSSNDEHAFTAATHTTSDENSSADWGNDSSGERMKGATISRKQSTDDEPGRKSNVEDESAEKEEIEWSNNDERLI
jgi:hypothetical protein